MRPNLFGWLVRKRAGAGTEISADRMPQLAFLTNLLSSSPPPVYVAGGYRYAMIFDPLD
jgi:hypothetical protein